MDLEAFIAEWQNDSPTLLVHTSGSTGKPKPLLVEKQRMMASARITCEFLGLKKGDKALLCMPLDYIAGKMMVVRALQWDLQLMAVEPSGHPLKALNEHIDFAAMVPLQVYNSLQVPEERERLRQIGHLIIGGGAIDQKMADELKTFPHAVWSTYGMTETLSHIALRRLSGPQASEWYTPFPTVSVSLSADDCLVIDAPQVCSERLVTNDIAEVRADGCFRIKGRKDNVICSGGLKIQIEEVERLLKEHFAGDYLISKRKDERLGEAVVLLSTLPETDARAVCEQVLPKHWRPRYYIQTDRLPRTETGKPARYEAERMAQ